MGETQRNFSGKLRYKSSFHFTDTLLIMKIHFLTKDIVNPCYFVGETKTVHQNMKEPLLLTLLFPVICTDLAPGEIRRIEIAKRSGNSWEAKIENSNWVPFNITFTSKATDNLKAWQKVLNDCPECYAATLPEKEQNVTFDFGGLRRFVWKVELNLPVNDNTKVDQRCRCINEGESWVEVSYSCLHGLSRDLLNDYAKLQANNQIRTSKIYKHCKNGSVISFTFNWMDFRHIPVSNFTLYLNQTINPFEKFSDNKIKLRNPFLQVFLQFKNAFLTL